MRNRGGDCDNCGSTRNIENCGSCDRPEEEAEERGATPPAPATELWKVSKTYKRDKEERANIFWWDTRVAQGRIIVQNIRPGDAHLICKAVNAYIANDRCNAAAWDLLQGCIAALAYWDSEFPENQEAAKAIIRQAIAKAGGK